MFVCYLLALSLCFETWNLECTHFAATVLMQMQSLRRELSAGLRPPLETRVYSHWFNCLVLNIVAPGASFFIFCVDEVDECS